MENPTAFMVLKLSLGPEHTMLEKEFEAIRYRHTQKITVIING
jgi:hypothetical protein